MSGFQFDINEMDDDFFDNYTLWTGKNATIFLIDTSQMMLQKCNEDEDSPFIKSLKCAHSTVSRNIMKNDQNLYGIVLFHTSKSKNPLDFNNIYVLQDLNRPGAESMVELENLIQDGTKEMIKDKFGNSKDTNIHEVLWVCRNIFSGCKKNLVTKNVLLFTCEDDPHSGDDHKQRQAVKGAKDMMDSGIDFEILPLSPNFKLQKFYKNLLKDDEQDKIDGLLSLNDAVDRFDELLERVRLLEHKQKTVGKVSFSIATGVEMGVKVFSAIRRITKTKVKLYKVTNEEVISQHKMFLENGEVLMPSDFVKYLEFGGKKMKFTMDEMKSLSKVYDTGIELLGFKPLSTFTPYLYVKPSNFIYPDESSVKGSSKLFTCLLERCVSRKVCPVVRVISREGGSTSWAFLLPQEEVKDERGCQDKPPGFHICYLPFADDFRSVKLLNQTRGQLDQVDAAKDAIKKLNFKYHPDCFENPDVQTHWRNIEALALNRHYLDPVTDYTVPDYEGIEKKAGSLINILKSLTLPAGYDSAAVIKKRPLASISNSSGPKRAKCDSSVMDMEEIARQKKVHQVTVDVLKSWLLSHKLRVTGKKKAQMVQDVYDELKIEV